MNWRRRERVTAAPTTPDDERADGTPSAVREPEGSLEVAPETTGPETHEDPVSHVEPPLGRDDLHPGSNGAQAASSHADSGVDPATDGAKEQVAGDAPAAPAAATAAATPPAEPVDLRTEHHAVILSVINQKGGVGKTTTTVSLGAALAQLGAQVLIVDLDPQGNATTGLGLRGREGGPSTYRVLVEGQDIEDATEPTGVRGLHVLPSSLDLAGAEIELVPQFSRENRLRTALEKIRDLYDVVLVDCPPSLGLLTVNALVAADQVLVPIQCEYYALEGLGQLLRTVELVRSSLNRELKLGGVLMTMFDARTNLSQQVVDEVRGHFGDDAFQTIIPRTVRLSEAPSYGQPITVFDPSSRGARAYARLAEELARRLGLLDEPEASPLDRLLGDVDSTPDPVPDPVSTPVADPVGVAVGAENGLPGAEELVDHPWRERDTSAPSDREEQP